ncbi:MAG: hypothetical protein IJO03_00055 [Clostridia bacterium]|nr:hypothetical protein [Clostridia bacterium]MBQ7120636.1 hypothetical protein [Clostridia bacterium]
MKKLTAILLVLSIFVLAFCGCTSENGDVTENPSETVSATEEITASESEPEETTVVSETSENKSEAQTTKAPDASKPAAGEKGNMVIGKIVAVAGNQITIDVAEIDGDFEMPEMNFEDFSMPEGMSIPEGMEPPADFDGEMPDFSGGGFPGGFPGGSFPGGDFPEGMTMPEGMSMPDFANGNFPSDGQMPQFDMGDIELKYTGTKEKYIIPKGVKVGSGDYTSLSKGMVVGLQLDESGTVTSVMIISQ